MSSETLCNTLRLYSDQVIAFDIGDSVCDFYFTSEDQVVEIST